MSRTNRNRRKKMNRKITREINRPGQFDFWNPLLINTDAATYQNGTSYGMMFTDKKPCEDNDTNDYLSSLPGAHYEDNLGSYHDHRDEDGEYTDQGVYEDFSGQPDPDKRYGPHLCLKCNDTHPNCQRVRCNVCGNVVRRFRWIQRMMMQLKIENPRRTVLWTPVG